MSNFPRHSSSLLTNQKKPSTSLLDRSFRKMPLIKPETSTFYVAFQKVLKFSHLLGYGVGNMIGAGIFFVTVSLAQTVGPAFFLSYILTMLSSLLTASCFLELASKIPYSGSGYAYIYVCFGELPAFLAAFTIIVA